MLVLPEFSLLKRQPKVPHVARVLLRREVPNEYGTPITFTVQQSRNGKDWWIGASREGMRMSDTLRTSTRAKAEAWIKAVDAGQVRVGEKKTKAQLDRELDEALAKLKEKQSQR